MAKVKQINVNDIVTETALCKLFDQYASNVLHDYTQDMERKKRERYKVKVTKELPTQEEYQSLKQKHYTTTVETLISDAFSEIESLRDEMQERYDNMPENLQGGDIGTRCEEAASTLDNCQQPDYPSSLGTIECVFLPSLKEVSRADRCSEAQSMLETAKDELQSVLDSEEKENGETQKHNAIETLMDELDEAIQTLSDVEFPGMYG